MTSPKPLTAAEIEYKRKTCMYACVRDCATCCGGYHPRMTPPPDAALREAVERVTRCAEEDPIPKALANDLRTLLSYLRAVQAPRLTPEQVEAVRDAEESLRINADEYPADGVAAERLCLAFPAAFPAAFGVGEG